MRDLFGDGPRVGKGKLPYLAQGDVFDNQVGQIPAQAFLAFAADAIQLDRLVPIPQFDHPPPYGANDITVKGTAQAAFRRYHHQQMHIVLAAADHHGGGGIQARQIGRDGRDHPLHAFSIRARLFRGILGPAQLSRGHHLHGLGDLLRRGDGGDPVF